MTTLPFTRKNNLLSLLRGYDLPIKRNYLNAALLGYGKHHKTDEEKKEERYQNFRFKVIDALEKCFNAFRKKLTDNTFWHSRRFFNALCAFTRFAVAGWSETSSEFLENLEGFLSEIAQSRRYNNLLGTMNKLANEQKAQGKTPKKYKMIKEESKTNIRKITYRLLWAEETPDIRGITNLILDCIVYSTETPEDFALNWDRYTKAVAMSSDTDIMKIFSEDLQDTAADDDEESEGEYDTDDEDFVVSDNEEIPEIPPPKRLRRVEEDSDEEEVNGSGFYDWWW